MTTPRCLACRKRRSITITEDGYTPLCKTCLDRVGTPVEIGGRAVCHIGSIIGTVVRFEESTWRDSGLAELQCDDGGWGWFPLAELAPVR